MYQENNIRERERESYKTEKQIVIISHDTAVCNDIYFNSSQKYDFLRFIYNIKLYVNSLNERN